MSTQVQKLEALLRRVQNNRDQPRAAGPAGRASYAQPVPVAAVQVAPIAPAAAPKPLPQPVDFARAPVQAVPAVKPAAEPARSKAAASPLQAAVETRAGQPGTARGDVRGEVLAELEVAEPSKPIAQVVSKHPPAVALNFGELLRRSLALRPR